MQSIRPFLWFDGQAREAALHYLDVFGEAAHTDADLSGEVGPYFQCTVRIGELELILFNAGPEYRFNEAISLFVTCDDQAEVDRYWDAFCEQGEPGRCGWLKDRFGVSWQIVPSALGSLLGDPDPARAAAAQAAMMTMSKLDVAAIRAAADAA